MFVSKGLLFRRLSYIGITIYGIKSIRDRYIDVIEELDEFSIYTNAQQRKNVLSGMHQPFVTNNIEELNIFEKYFREYEFLIARSVDEIQSKQSIKSPVRFKYLSEVEKKRIDYKTSTLIVGGPPALISGVKLIENDKNLIYLNDSRRIPISNGSAWHLEQDAQTEAPTNYKPTEFLVEQMKRLLLNNVSFKKIYESGQFPWRTIDWIEWLRHPDHWFRALKLSFQFQWLTMFSDRTNLLNDVAKQCFINQHFFDQLNKSLKNKILLEEHGSIIVARNKQEIDQLNQLNNDLIKEGRVLKFLTKEEMLNRFHFIPNGSLFAEKDHDRVLKPNFMKILKEFLQKQGATIVDGTLKTIYIDQNQNEGIALIENSNGEQSFIQFSRLILSLGNQEIFNLNNKRLFDVVSARGVSVLAHLYLPKGFQLPPVLVCGGTNHATNLSPKPISFNQHYDLYLMRLTAGACITPNLSNQSTSNYDATIAVGLIQAVKKTFGNECKVHPIFVYGCNRQVSQYGQINWIQPFQNIFIQYGAAGGGLTRAPDFINKFNL
jgi:hypothetical protein